MYNGNRYIIFIHLQGRYWHGRPVGRQTSHLVQRTHPPQTHCRLMQSTRRRVASVVALSNSVSKARGMCGAGRNCRAISMRINLKTPPRRLQTSARPSCWTRLHTAWLQWKAQPFMSRPGNTARTASPASSSSSTWGAVAYVEIVPYEHDMYYQMLLII